MGLNLEEILTRKAMSKPHRTIVDSHNRRTTKKIICDALKPEIKKELRTT